MIEYLVGICLLLLTVGHGILIHGCMKWAVERRASTGMIDDRLAALATLLDEALDLFSDITGDAPSNNPMTQTPFDMKEILSTLLMSKLMPDPQHGTQEERQISEEENDTPQEKTEV
jgi:hypothetical protein